MRRIGFHYHDDTLHYTKQDLEKWQPELKSLGASWLILNTPEDRAIPEAFITSLVESGITPILHFKISPEQPISPEELRLFLANYARWGVKCAILFDKPNLCSTWSAKEWSQGNLVERFLDTYVPLARTCLQSGIAPVLPPLEPGGDYWDTIFLREALEGLKRRGHKDLLDRVVLSAYARTDTQPLNWGLGGPERWPGVLPYSTNSEEQDHRGFRIYDWYQAITKAVLGVTRPIMLLGLNDDAKKMLMMANLFSKEAVSGVDPIPREVLFGAFQWDPTQKRDTDSLLAGSEETKGEPSPGDLFRQKVAKNPKNADQPQSRVRFIDHYLLLPSFEWGVADFHLEAIRPYVKKYQPTIGFSIDEAENAHRVTVIGGMKCYSDEALSKLRTSGCIVERIAEDGTELASKLASL